MRKILAQSVFALVLGLFVLLGSSVRPVQAAHTSGANTLDLAATLSMTPAVGAHVEIKGTVEAVGAGSLTVSGTSMATDANTKFHPNQAAVVVGVSVEVEGVYQADLSVLATEVDVKQASSEFKGLIESFSATQWVVGGRTFTIDANTAVRGTPVVGRLAEVKAAQQPDGSYLALKIEVKQSSSRRFAFTGVLKSMSATEGKVYSGPHCQDTGRGQNKVERLLSRDGLK